MYAYFKKLDYFSTECIYSPYAARGFAREFVKDLEVCLSAACSATGLNFRAQGSSARTKANTEPYESESCQGLL